MIRASCSRELEAGEKAWLEQGKGPSKELFGTPAQLSSLC